MGVIERVRGKRVYFDTNIFIYIFEGLPKYQALVKPILDLIDLDEIEVFTNELTLGELLVKPFKLQEETTVQRYIKTLNDSNFVTLTSTTQDIHIEAARFRAIYRMKQPDAIHVAAALDSKCDVFLTNDTGIKVSDEIELISLKSAAE